MACNTETVLTISAKSLIIAIYCMRDSHYIHKIAKALRAK